MEFYSADIEMPCPGGTAWRLVGLILRPWSWLAGNSSLPSQEELTSVHARRIHNCWPDSRTPESNFTSAVRKAGSLVRSLGQSGRHPDLHTSARHLQALISCVVGLMPRLRQTLPGFGPHRSQMHFNLVRMTHPPTWIGVAMGRHYPRQPLSGESDGLKKFVASMQ
jgi:hypothetical protein